MRILRTIAKVLAKGLIALACFALASCASLPKPFLPIDKTAKTVKTSKVAATVGYMGLTFTVSYQQGFKDKKALPTLPATNLPIK